MTSESKWKEMLDEFRALGGTAENIRLGYGPLGRGLFPIDPAKPVAISIPASLLIPLDHVFFDDNVFRVRNDSGASERARAFLERYECDFAWGTEARDGIERVLTIMHTLPEELRDVLKKRYGLGNLFRPLTSDWLQEAFLGSRAINFGKCSVVMPIIELANHGGSVRYGGNGSVSLEGEFEKEVLVRYSACADPYDFLTNWLFVSQEQIAFSLPMTYTKGGKVWGIDRVIDKEQWPWMPTVSVAEDTISLSYLLVGHKGFPRVPRASFHKALSNAGLALEDEVFEEIQHANRQNLLDLIGVLEGVDSSAVPLIRTMACYQLAASSCYFGTRELL